MGDVFFSSNFDENFFPHGRDSYRDADGDVDITVGMVLIARIRPRTMAAKWVGAAMSAHLTVDTNDDGVPDALRSCLQ